MNALKQEGVIYSIQGKGTYVSCDYSIIANSLNLNESMTEMIESSGYKCNTSLFVKKIVKADTYIATGLGIEENTDVLMCERVRQADDIPVVYSVDYLAAHLWQHFLGITDENISLYSFIEEECHIEIGRCMTEIVPVISDDMLSEKLEVAVGTPLLKFIVMVQDTHCKPIIYAVEYLRADKFRFILNRRR